MNNKKLLISSIVLNEIIIMLVGFSLVCYFVNIAPSSTAVVGIRCFKYFTVDSNLLLAISSFILLIYEIKALQTGEYTIPKAVTVLKFCGVISVSVTFWVVLLYIGKAAGWAVMYTGVDLILHLIVPLLSFISYVFFEKDETITWEESLYGVIPMALYGIIYWIMTVPIYHMTGEWNDFYHLNTNGMGWLNFSIIFICTAVFCVGIWWLKKKLSIIKKV